MPETILILSIDCTGRLRDPDRDRVALLAQSIEQTRLEQPIVVRPFGDGYKLVVGGHRLEALKRLGWTELTVGEHVLVRETDEDDAQLAEIDENVVRNELEHLDRALFFRKRQELYLKTARTRGRGGDRRSQELKDKIKAQTLGFDFEEGFAANAAKRFGLSKSAVELAVKIAKNLKPETVAAIRGTMVARNQQELIALSEIEGEEQVMAAQIIQSGQAKTVLQAKIALDPKLKRSTDPQAALFPAFVKIWKKADKRTRALITSFIETGKI